MGKEFGHTGPHERGTKLINGPHESAGHHGQPKGHGGYPGGYSKNAKAEHLTHMETAHSFKPPAANMAHGYGHGVGQRKGVHRLSGDPKAHMLGCKK